MSKLLKYRWSFGFGALATAAAAIALLLLLTPANVRAKAADVMARGAQAIAHLTSVHLRGQLRTLPADNFSYIGADEDFYPIELWKQLEPDLKWRIEKPARVAVMDGQQTLLYFKNAKEAVRLDHPTPAAFDTAWLHHIADLSNTISNEIRHAQAKGWQMDLAEQTAADGRRKAIVTVHARSGVPDDDYVKNNFLETADTRRVYTFDTQTEMLEAVQLYLVRSNTEVQIFDLNQIDYNQPMDAAIWHVELPADVSFYKEPQKLPDNEKYASMTAEDAARAFFEACARNDWDEVAKFQSPINQQFKNSLGGLQLVSLGKPFDSTSYSGRFIPYEIKLRPQTVYARVSNDNPAKRYVISGILDSQMQPEQQFKWSTPPEALAANDPDASLSAADVVKACAAALAKLDWAELRKFAPAEYVQQTQRQFDQVKKQGLNPLNFVPAIEVGEASMTPDHSAWLVKCQMSEVKKWNLAMRKDNPAGRWQVDGGI